MKLYGDHRSGNCDKVRFTADHLGLDYTWIEIDSVGGETRRPDFLRVNPQGQVPAVQFEDGRCLAQSNAIVRYLARGTRLLPTDAWLAARVDEWLFWEANNHEFFVAGCIGHMTYMGRTRESRDPLRVARGERALDIMDAHLTGSDWFVGHEPSVADVALLAYTRHAPRGGFDLAGRHALRAWIARCEAALGLRATAAADGSEAPAAG
jgi:glutathione S-transferase